MSQVFRWGVLGPGRIARKFAGSLAAWDDMELAAAGSRNRERAQAFLDEFGGGRAYGSYEELVADEAIDGIYVATPHTGHCEHGILALEAGKAVLCEKPLTVNAEQAEKLIACARREKTFLMEAMWTRFLPIMDQVREWLAAGAIGELRMLQADFAFRGSDDVQGRHLNPDLAGGGLLDVGVYPIALAFNVFPGGTEAVSAIGTIGSTGVDEQAGMLMRFKGGPLAVLACGVRTTTNFTASIFGTEGRIEIHRPWWQGTTATLHQPSGEETVERKHLVNGFEYQVRAAADAARDGKQEHPLMPLDESLAIARTMDEMRRQMGVKYPFE